MRSRKRQRKRLSQMKKSTIAVLAVALIAIAAIGTTIAYVETSSNSVKNKFDPSKIVCEIEEEVSDGTKSSVMIKNTGEVEAFMRAAVIANTVDTEGNITGAADVSGSLCGKNWIKSGNYYYYTQPVAPKAETENLLISDIKLSGIQVTILAEAIQSEPASAVQSAWGVSPASLGTN